MPLKLHGAQLMISVAIGAFFIAASAIEIPLHIVGGGAWPLLSAPVGLLAFIAGWWAAWRCCIAISRDVDAGADR